MAASCGSAQANAKKARCSLEETRASSNGPGTSAKKRKEKPKTATNACCIPFPTIFHLFFCGFNKNRATLKFKKLCGSGD
jgi:hypothetical protein